MNYSQAVSEFLGCETPMSWVNLAIEHQDLLLIDHAHCEKKAASTALNLMFRYVDKPELLHALSRLAREELRHFEQVCEIMQQRQITYRHLTPSRYAEILRKEISTYEPNRLIDILIVGGFIEARSCERFNRLYPHLDLELSKFYQRLLRSEARHFQLYIDLAKLYSENDITQRIDHIRQVEKKLILSEDDEFRFHSGATVLAAKLI